MNLKIKAVIFDYDGVLVDSMDLCLPRWQAISKKFGSNNKITREMVKKTFFGGWQNFYQTTLGVPAAKLPEGDRMYHELSEQQKRPALFKEINKVVASLSKSFSLYVVTASNTEKVKHNLKEQRILDYFQDVWGQDKMPDLKKSQPEFILTPLKHWKIDPKHACSIGDTQDEIRTGKLAGLYTIACTWGWNTSELLKEVEPNVIIDKPTQIIQAVSQLN